jgi:hypothetical protein
MRPIHNALIVLAFLVLSPFVMAESGKDCLLQGTVLHGEQAGQDTTTVKINSISQYDEESRCSMRRSQKMEFKLPHDTRLKDAPSGSEVKYRYRTDETGQADTELISVGA